MINILLYILFFILSYLIASKIIISLKSDKYKKRNNLNYTTNEYSLKELFSKFNFLKTKENFLSKQGYPLKLNAISYYILKVSFALLLFLAGSINYHSVYIALVFFIIGYYFIDAYILINKKSRDSEICIDLLNVVNSISLQLSAHLTLKDSLKKQFENCKNKDFKKAILEFSMKYELSEFNIDDALDELKSKFDILEINMFCNSLKEYNKVGDIIEILENLSNVLKIKYIEKIRETTRTKVLYITFGVIVALGNIILLTFYPLFTSIGQGFNTIFK
jgi:Flp pilus assembly protein TadB